MTRRVAGGLVLVTVTLMLVGLVISFGREPVYDTLLYGLLLPGVLLGSGVLVARRHPANPIGWLFCALAVWTSLAELAQGYGLFARDHGRPGGVWGEWVISWSWIVDTAFWLVIFLLFPDGRLTDRRWRIVLAVGFVGVAIALPGAMLVDNPAAYSAGRNPLGVDSKMVPLLLPVGMTLATLASLGAIVSIGVRFRRSRGIERQQLKWFLVAGAGFVAIMPFAVIFWFRTTLVHLPVALAISAIPVATAIAILRYRLYDVDLVINRALVYGALTATLAASYLAGVLILQFALRPLTDRSDLAVAGSTLAVAALFRPARGRIQAVVDRRFYRSRYDAARTLDAFGFRLRDQLDLEALDLDLRGVVRDTVAPTHVSLWLREVR